LSRWIWCIKMGTVLIFIYQKCRYCSVFTSWKFDQATINNQISIKSTWNKAKLMVMLK
jgi:hypothetical protein